MGYSSRGRALAWLALALVAAATHLSTVSHPFLLDDDIYIVRNQAVTDGAPLTAYFADRETTSSERAYNTQSWRPLRTLAFRVVARLFGVRPLAFGLANLLLYVLAVLGVRQIVAGVTPDSATAFAAAALWALLPVHVEPVAYASALGDQLSLALELAALVVALPLLDEGAPLRPGRTAASLVLALAAMLTKEMAVTEPALLALVALARQPRPWRSPSARRLVAAHVVVAVGYVVARTLVLGVVGQAPLDRAAVAAGLRDAPALLARYVAITLAPLGHAASYHVPAPSTPLWLALVVATALVLVAAWRWRRGVAVGLGWFVVSLVPVLHVVPLFAELADRFALVPSVGLAIAAAAALAPLRRPAAIALVAVVAIGYAAATQLEARPWQSDALLWRYAVDRQPDAPLARINLAAVLLGEGRVDEAAAQLDAWHALGYTRPDLEVRRAWVYARVGRRDEAERVLAYVLSRDPQNAQAHALAGELALERGDVDGATRALVLARATATAHPSVGLLGFLVKRARGDASIGAHDARVEYLRALEALSFYDAAAAVAAARACLAEAPERVACEGALGEALTLQAPLDDGSRRALADCLAKLSPGRERDRCQQALWLAQGR